MNHKMHAIFKGKVQGVGFRYTTCLLAKTLNLTGTVSNLSDGSVEVFAYGPKDSLEKLVKKLQEKAFSEYIQAVSVDFFITESPLTDFQII